MTRWTHRLAGLAALGFAAAPLPAAAEVIPAYFGWNYVADTFTGGAPPRWT
jgi:hypothetical protein